MTITTHEELAAVPVGTVLTQSFHGTTNTWTRIEEGMRLGATGSIVPLSYLNPLAEGNVFTITTETPPESIPVQVGQVRIWSGGQPMLVLYIDHQVGLVDVLGLTSGYTTRYRIDLVGEKPVSTEAVTINPENLHTLARHLGGQAATQRSVQFGLNELLGDMADDESVRVEDVIGAVSDMFDVTRPMEEIEVRVVVSGHSLIRPEVDENEVSRYASVTIDDVESTRVDWTSEASFTVSTPSGSCACDEVDTDMIGDWLSNQSFNYEDFDWSEIECDNC